MALGQANQGFPRQARLIKTDDFSSVFSFRKRIAGQFLVVHYQPNQLNHLRLGVVVAKKVTRLAAQRNYMKRVLRELFRKQKFVFENTAASGFDVIIRTQKTFTTKEFLVIQTEFLMLFSKLHKRVQAQHLPLNQSVLTN